MVRIEIVTRTDEDLLLDLLNTTPVVEGERTDELAGAGQARAWARAHGGTGTAAEVAALTATRDAVAAVVRGDGQPSSLAPHLEQVTLRPVLRDGAVEWIAATAQGEQLAARALLAWVAIQERAPGRLRPCANTDCCRFLHDRSNANTARWCSMALCGNRAKARRHYQRSRGIPSA